MKKTVKLTILGFVLHCYVAYVTSTDENSGTADTPAPTSVSDHNKQVAENRLSSQIFAIIDHFHQEDPLGLPGAPVPDPFAVPDVKKSIAVGTLTMRNTLAYGMSKFRLKYIKTDLNELTVQ